MRYFRGLYYNDNDFGARTTTTDAKKDNNGRELHTTRRQITCNDTLCSIENPMLVALDTSELKERCYNCYKKRSDPLKPPQEDDGTPSMDFMPCEKCEAVFFCDERCLKLAQRSFHDMECDIFRSLLPQMPSSNLRAVMRVLLVRNRPFLFMHQYWQSLIKCDGKVEQLRKAGGKRWEELVNFTQCAMQFTKTTETFEVVLNLFCLLLSYGVPLQTTYFKSIGVAFHPWLIGLSHSCEPNSMISFNPSLRFGGHCMRIIPIRPISKDEMLTIAYLDGSAPLSVRQNELRTNFFVNCKCTKCQTQAESTDSESTPDRLSIIKRVVELTDAADSDQTIHMPIERLRFAMHLLAAEIWPVNLFPLPMVARKLAQAYINDHQFNLAFVYAATLHFVTEESEIRYTSPITMADDYLLVRLMDKVINGESWSSQTLKLSDRGLNLVGIKNELAGRVLQLGNRNDAWKLPPDATAYLQHVRNTDKRHGDFLMNDEEKMTKSWDEVADLVDEIQEKLKRW